MTEFALCFVLFFLLGLAVGSFLNVCIDRLPREQSIIKPPSHCGHCQQRLRVADLIPLFSYFWLRGRCRYCHASIPRRTLAVELATGLAFPLLYWHFGLTALLGVSLVYASLYLIIFVIDLEHMLILDKVVYPGMGLALVFSFLPGNIGGLKAIEGGALGLFITLLPFLIFSGGFGFGDVKLAALVGLSTGFPQMFVALFISLVGGGIVAITLLLSGVKRRKDPIPFAPFFTVAAMLTLLWGKEIIDWYQAIAWLHR